ncbi:pyruvate dehydrogenase protein X component, mitochondrial-like [Acanthaster planci]|uniref:Dihydrolipoamide acetyltransferase component of pyruvate dehydrogenase complex n=1 Tax=Acanthaster planci TaxID=133434 RepID=A0A8B7XP93_ACAPL|nr:pyruvate dehydrogenase protein X component, mitochondrial-like [Acanthaster planci]
MPPLIQLRKPFPRRCNVRNITRSNFLAGVEGTKLLMPALSPTMEEGTILKWLKREGDVIAAGDALCEIETDKATLTLDADDDGVLAKILVPEGTSGVKISSLIALLVAEGEDYKAVEMPADADAGPPPGDATVSEGQIHGVSDTVQFSSMRHAVGKDSGVLSPAVRQLLDTHQLSAGDILPSGPHGRLLKGDVLQYIQEGGAKKSPSVEAKVPEPTPQAQTATPAPKFVPPATELQQQATYTDIELTNIRKVIAKRLTESKRTIPHSYASTECNMDHVMKIRKDLQQEGIKVSVNDFIIKAAAVALKELPDVNASWSGKEPQRLPDIDISVAVATDKGLITPIVKNAIGKGLVEISENVKDLAARAREGKLQLHEFQGGSFSISNLGMFGISKFTAVINPPQACILAVGTARMTLSKSLKPQAMTTVMLSSDGRVVDDALAATFLRSFKKNLENPLRLGIL